jgi:hypothetical protein
MEPSNRRSNLLELGGERPASGEGDGDPAVRKTTMAMSNGRRRICVSLQGNQLTSRVFSQTRRVASGISLYGIASDGRGGGRDP